MHRNLLLAIIIMVCAAAIIGLIQLWVPGAISWDIFIKIMITLSILIVLAALILVFASDLGSHKKMKDENYLD